MTFEVLGPPVAEGYCHYNDCRNRSVAPFFAFSLWLSGAVAFTKDEASVDNYSKFESSVRKFTAACGGKLMINHPGVKSPKPH